LIVSGTTDTLTPTWMAEKIFAQANQPKQLYIVPGAGHDDLLTTGGNELTQVLRRFVQESAKEPQQQERSKWIGGTEFADNIGKRRTGRFRAEFQARLTHRFLGENARIG